MQVTKCDKCRETIDTNKERRYYIWVWMALPKLIATKINEVEYCEKCFKEDCPALIRRKLPSL